jgi:hypothetical protein
LVNNYESFLNDVKNSNEIENVYDTMATEKSNAYN